MNLGCARFYGYLDKVPFEEENSSSYVQLGRLLAKENDQPIGFQPLSILQVTFEHFRKGEEDIFSQLYIPMWQITRYAAVQPYVQYPRHALSLEELQSKVQEFLPEALPLLQHTLLQEALDNNASHQRRCKI